MKAEMQIVEKSFEAISNSLKEGQFTRAEMELIIQFCQIVERSTSKALERGPVTVPESNQ